MVSRGGIFSERMRASTRPWGPGSAHCPLSAQVVPTESPVRKSSILPPVHSGLACLGMTLLLWCLCPFSLVPPRILALTQGFEGHRNKFHFLNLVLKPQSVGTQPGWWDGGQQSQGQEWRQEGHYSVPLAFLGHPQVVFRPSCWHGGVSSELC